MRQCLNVYFFPKAAWSSSRILRISFSRPVLNWVKNAWIYFILKSACIGIENKISLWQGKKVSYTHKVLKVIIVPLHLLIFDQNGIVIKPSYCVRIIQGVSDLLPKLELNFACHIKVNTTKVNTTWLYRTKTSTLPGLEPGIPWFVVRCLIHWATGPWLTHPRP